MLFQADHISHSYGYRSILKNISLSVPTGAVIGLLGPNGSGKTTLLKIIAGLIRPTQDGFINKPSRISLLLGDLFFYRELTLRENLQFYKKIYGADDFLLEELISRFGLRSFMNQPVKILSKGEKLRGALTRAFLMKAELTLLDEPFAGLDVNTAALLISYLKKIKGEGQSLVISTHNPQELGELVDQWWAIEEGRLL